jgi:PKD repeat protein
MAADAVRSDKRFMKNNWLIPLLLILCAAGPDTRPAATEPWQPGSGHPKAIGILLSAGIAPSVLHVNAVRFPLEHGTPLTARYDWNFGDPQGKYNTLTGFNAAHMYQMPGEYAVTLRVTDETGLVESSTARIVISPNHRRAIFVSPEGSDNNVGTSPEAPFHTLAKAFSVLPEDCQILLRAGTVNMDDTALLLKKSNVVIDRYGEGSDPVIMLNKQEGPKAPHGVISIDKNCNGVTFQHLIFDSPFGVGDNDPAPKIAIDAITARGRNISVLNCTFRNVDNGVDANGAPTGLLVQDCSAPLKTGIRAYMVWTQGTDFVCLGNSAANSTREHIVRLTGVERVLIAFNNFTNLDRRPADKYDTSKGCIEMHKGSYAYIANNTATDGDIRVGPLGQHGEDPSSATDWAVIEGNTILNTPIRAYCGAHHVMIRNNIIHADGTQAIILEGPDKDGRMNSDIRIFNNTAIDNAATGAFIKVWGHVDGIELKNNLFIAPNLKTGINGAAAVNVAEPARFFRG